MNELLQAFLLGNAAILTNVCVLPLYPGLIAYLAGTAQNERARKASKWLGIFVLAGVLTLMIIVGGILYALEQSFGSILPFLLPAIYIIVIAMGALMITGRNPFNRLATVQTPILRNPYLGAYVYGLLLGPMTLPCAGPIVVSAFLLGAGSFSSLADGLLYFLFFGIGFGWPLVIIPLLAAPFQRQLTRWTTQHYTTLTRASGALLVGIGLFGITTEVLPNLA
jgi:cytochrome c-type biogenesis protein